MAGKAPMAACTSFTTACNDATTAAWNSLSVVSTSIAGIG